MKSVCNLSKSFDASDTFKNLKNLFENWPKFFENRPNFLKILTKSLNFWKKCIKFLETSSNFNWKNYVFPWIKCCLPFPFIIPSKSQLFHNFHFTPLASPWNLCEHANHAFSYKYNDWEIKDKKWSLFTHSSSHSIPLPRSLARLERWICILCCIFYDSFLLLLLLFIRL